MVGHCETVGFFAHNSLAVSHLRSLVGWHHPTSIQRCTCSFIWSSTRTEVLFGGTTRIRPDCAVASTMTGAAGCAGSAFILTWRNEPMQCWQHSSFLSAPYKRLDHPVEPAIAEERRP